MMTMWCLELRRISDGSTYSASIISSMMRATMVRRITATLSEAASTTRLLVWSTSGTEAEGDTKRLAGEKLMCHMYKYIIFHSQLAGVGREATRGKSARSKAPPILSSISSSLSLMEEILCFYLFVSATFPIQDYNLKYLLYQYIDGISPHYF